MDNTNNFWDKCFIGFGIIVVLSGISLVFSKQYVAGISGSIVGIWLVAMNIQKIKGEDQ